MASLLTQLDRLRDALVNSPAQKTTDKVKAIYDFRARKSDYQDRMVQTHLRTLSEMAWRAAQEPQGNEKSITAILSLLPDLEKKIAAPTEALAVIEKMRAHASALPSFPEKRSAMPRLPALPPEIRDDVAADAAEIGRCMQAGCYRSAVILCGRILETALHRKYYDVTGLDILEKNPGIGLGTLIAKLREKNVDLDPALSQQIHLINQVRIFSVHTKQTAFHPSSAQAQAIVLYTMDALERLI